VIELHLRGYAASGRHAELVAFLAEAIPFYEQPGGIRVRVLWDVGAPNRFVEIIEYADRAAYDRDQVRVEHDPQMRDYLKRWQALLDGPPQVEMYQVDTPGAVGKPGR
jgi:quinol monooxygenase YgiN